MPAVGNTFQFMFASVFEDESRPGGQILDRLGDQDL